MRTPAKSSESDGAHSEGITTTSAKVTDEQLREWEYTGRPYKLIAAEIATWAADQERGTILPDNQVFGRKRGIDASASTYKRAKVFLVAQGVLSTDDVATRRRAVQLGD